MLTSMNCPSPPPVAMEQRGEDADQRPVAAGVEALAAAAAHRRQRVVVVAAGPDRPAAREDREVRERLEGCVDRRARTA